MVIVPRLHLDHATAMALRAAAERNGHSLSDEIAEIIKAGTNQQSPDETLFRMIQVGERFGLGVGGSSTYPQDWITVGGLTREASRELAVKYLAWKRTKYENAGRLTREIDGGC